MAKRCEAPARRGGSQTFAFGSGGFLDKKKKSDLTGNGVADGQDQK